jgi:hypothetical protein
MGEGVALRGLRPLWRLRRLRHIGSSCDSLELLALSHARLLARSGAAAFACLFEGGDLHDAARNGDLAAVKARPSASTVCGSCSFALSYRRLLTPGWFSGPPSVNAQDSSGYAPVCFFPSSRCSNSTLS